MALKADPDDGVLRWGFLHLLAVDAFLAAYRRLLLYTRDRQVRGKLLIFRHLSHFILLTIT